MCKACESAIAAYDPTYESIEKAVSHLLGQPFVFQGQEMWDILDRSVTQPTGIAMLAGEVMMTWNDTRFGSLVTLSL